MGLVSDQLLLILLMIEVLYTVQVSFREHVLVPEPFVLVAMIAAVRRILVLTAEFGTLMEQGEAAFRYAMIELGLLTATRRRWPSGREHLTRGAGHEDPADR
jgi:uncharacterized membrane protein (DUF373 family)